MNQTSPILIKIPGQSREKKPIKTIIVGPTAGLYRKLAESLGGVIIEINPLSKNTQCFNPLETPIKISTEK